jgi:hypothetical protein
MRACAFEAHVRILHIAEYILNDIFKGGALILEWIAKNSSMGKVTRLDCCSVFYYYTPTC